MLVSPYHLILDREQVNTIKTISGTLKLTSPLRANTTHSLIITWLIKMHDLPISKLVNCWGYEDISTPEEGTYQIAFIDNYDQIVHQGDFTPITLATYNSKYRHTYTAQPKGH
jgi:hypothetical protein